MEESNTALLHLLRVLDLRGNQFHSELAWSEAQRSLEEADEFTAVQRLSSDSGLVARLVQSHETKVLKGQNVSDIAPLVAAQYYRAHAAQRLVDASQGHPWCSELYYSIGKALQAQADQGGSKAQTLRERALVYYRAAHAISPENAPVASQLAFTLLQVDQPQEAYQRLTALVVQQHAPLAAWQNLIEASTRLGMHDTREWALQNYHTLAKAAPAASGEGATVVELDPRQFAMLSPYSSGPQTGASRGGAPPNPAATPAPQASAQLRTAGGMGWNR
jgi:hypothetical protein